jgi:hypothetical protein
MRTYRLVNRSTEDEKIIEAETIAIACRRLGWIPSMTQIELVKAPDED